MQFKDKIIRSALALMLAFICAFSSSVSHAQLSKKLLKKYQQGMGGKTLYDDRELAAYVERVGQKVLANSDHAGREYHFFLTDFPVPGASTVGDGLVFIDRGLLALLNSEAELAGVIGHEIGHNVGNHVGKKRFRYTAGNILANVASLLVGNSAVGNAMAVQNTANLYTFGREAELESDQYAAKYLHAAKYDPQAMLRSLSALADFSSWFSQVQNGPPRHHGVFTSHPRTDKRLHTVIDAAGQVPPGEENWGRDEYREAITGLVYGPSFKPNAPKGYERYISDALGITFVHPDTWKRTIKKSQIILKDENDAVQLKITISKTKDRNKTTEQLIKEKYPEDLANLEKFNAESARDLGTLGTRPNRRVALATVARTTFDFDGIAKNNVITKYQDEVMVYIIKSFRRLNPDDQMQETVTRIDYQRFEAGDTFASVAKALNDSDQTVESQLRLINGYYPKGEPEPGTWIKVFRKSEVTDKEREKAEKAL